MKPTLQARSLRHAAGSAILAAVVLTVMPFGASAAMAPSTPTVELVDGGDGFINGVEADEVLIRVHYDPFDLPPAVYAEGRIVGASSGDPCSISAPHTTTNQSSTIDLGGYFEIGPFDVTSFPEGVTLCARAFVRDATNAASTSGTSNTAVKDTIAPADGSVEMVEDFIVDGYLNRAETAGQCCIDANWSHPDPGDVASASVWFVDSADTITSGCGPWSVGASGFGSVNSACAASMSEGTFTFLGQWSDAAGNLTAEATASLIKDSIRPDVTFITPTVGTSVAPSTTVTVTGTTEPLSTLAYRLDGDLIGSGVADGDGAWSFSFTAPAALGTHTFRAVATDLASNARGRNLSFEVDDLVPIIVLPASGALEAATVTFVGTGRPLSTIELFDGATLVGSTEVDSRGDWVIVSGMSDGAHTVVAVATDGSETSGSSLPTSFLVDAGRPTVAITTATNSLQPSPLLVEGTAADGAEGVTSVRVSYFNLLGTRVFEHAAACVDCGPGATAVTWQSDPTLLPGIYTVVAEAVDAAGNRSQLQTIRLIAGP